MCKSSVPHTRSLARASMSPLAATAALLLCAACHTAAAAKFSAHKMDARSPELTPWRV